MTTRWTSQLGVIFLGALLALAGCSNGHRAPASVSSTPVSSGSPASSGSLGLSPAPADDSSRSPAGTTAAPAESSAIASPASPAVPTGFRPASVTFVSASVGFVLGDLPCATGRCTAFAATHDAGHTWTSLPGSIPVADPAAGVRVTEVRFATASDGWAFGPELWSTHDGGRSWHQTVEPGGVSDVEASSGVAYATVVPCSAEPCGKPGLFLRTTVGHDAWSPVPGVSISENASGITLHGPSVWVPDGTPGSMRLVTSADGTTWQQLADPCARLGPDWALAGVAAVSTSRVFLLCGGGAGAGSESKKVLVSTDGGAHGTPTATDPPRGGIASGIAAASGSVVAVAAQSGASWVYRSGDSGQLWSAPLTQGDGGVGYHDVGFTTASQGVAIYGDIRVQDQPTSLLITRDAGASWTPVSF